MNRKPVRALCIVACIAAVTLALMPHADLVVDWLQHGHQPLPGAQQPGSAALWEWLQHGWSRPQVDIPDPLPEEPEPTDTPSPAATATPKPEHILARIPYDLHAGNLEFSGVEYGKAPSFSDADALVDFFRLCRTEKVAQAPLLLKSPLEIDDALALVALFDWTADTSVVYGKKNAGTEALFTFGHTPGTRIALAYAGGDVSGLTPKEQRVLALASAFFESEYPKDAPPIVQKASLHDFICALTEYWTDNGQHAGHYADFRTALGVFLDGKANCMGYTDAFQMLATMAGFPVLSVSGEARSPEGGWEGHAWNAIELQGNWYFVDVTHNDLDDEDLPNHYKYFSIGSELIRHTHRVADGRAIPPVRPLIDENYPYGNALFPQLARMRDAEALSALLMARAMEAGGNEWRILAMCDGFDAEIEPFLESLTDAIAKELKRSVRVSFRHSMLGEVLYLSLAMRPENPHQTAGR